MELRDLLHSLVSRGLTRSDIVAALNAFDDPKLSATDEIVDGWFEGAGLPSLHQASLLQRIFEMTSDASPSGPGKVIARPSDARLLTPDELLIVTIARRIGFARALQRMAKDIAGTD